MGLDRDVRKAIIVPGGVRDPSVGAEKLALYWPDGTPFALDEEELQGPAGPQGEQGEQGPAGQDGADGADGAPGADGADGAPGADGADGDSGPPRYDNGQLAIPLASGSFSSAAPGANRIHAQRFVADADRLVDAIRYELTSGGPGDVCVALLDSAGARLATSGKVSGHLGSAAPHECPLTSAYQIVRGNVYYAAMCPSVAASFLALNTNMSNGSRFMGSGFPYVDTFYYDTGDGVIPANVPIGGAGVASQYVLAAMGDLT